jgi:hypothetical protein
MNPQTRIRYHFHAEGHALGGEFRHPSWIPIQAQAATSLPTIGGHSTAHVEDFHVQDFVSFRRAHTHVSGKRRRSDAGDTFVTHATSTIEGLNILGVVTAERIVCRLSSIHSPKLPEGHIVAEDSRFEGLRVKDQDVKVTLRHNLLVDCKTFDDLVTKGIANDVKKGKIAFIDREQEVAICSLVEKIEPKLKGVDVSHNLIEVPDFGKIFLAEVFTDPGTRTLTMLRLELGSPHVADVTVAETRTNGVPYP